MEDFCQYKGISLPNLEPLVRSMRFLKLRKWRPIFHYWTRFCDIQTSPISLLPSVAPSSWCFHCSLTGDSTPKISSWFPWVWCHLSTTHHCHPLTESCPADPPLLDQTRASASPANGSQLFFNILIFFDFSSSSIYANISSLNICCWYQRIQAPAAASEKWE